MFGNLIESSSHKGDYARKGGFFLGTLAVYALAFLMIGVGSIYAYNTHIETQNLELVSLIAPVESPEAPPVQRPVVPRPTAGGGNNSKVAVVKTPPVFATMDPRHVIDKAMVAPPAPELPPNMDYRIGTPSASDNLFGGSGNKPTGGGNQGTGTGDGSKELDDLARTTPPPVMRIEPRKTVTKSVGVVNGMATHLPKPVYTAIAKAARASGTVTVQVLIDEYGKVISAKAVSGNPLLLRESVQAAYQARFTPTLLSNQPVKVSGVITYNFVLQ